MLTAMTNIKKGKKTPKKLSADQATEQIVQMIAQSIASLPKKERLAAMEAFDLTAEAISARGEKAPKPPKFQPARPAPAHRKKS